MTEDDDYDATPNLGDVLDMMEGYGYDLWDADIELVDNTYQTFITKNSKFSKLKNKSEINITFDNSKRTFRITDNAFGMNRNKLEEALLLAQKNTQEGIIGKYGMGLKTAASWLGKHWTVRTKELGSNFEYTATVDINRLKKNKSNNIPIKQKHVSDSNSSYTIIDVKQGCRPYGSSTTSKTKRELELTYQKILSDDKLVINWKGESLEYKEPPILTVEEKITKDGKTENKTIKYDYDIPSFNINGSKIKGRYGIYEPQGSSSPTKSQVPHAGLTMYYNNRVILTRSRDKWMEKIFGSGPGDLARQRLFLKLEVELTPNALKTDFLWKEYTIEKLEEKIIEETDKHIIELRKLATDFRKKKGTMSGAAKKLSDSDIKKRMESLDVGSALAPASVAVVSDVKEITESEIVEFKKLDKNRFKFQLTKDNQT